jgi:diguanylate cyclase (GGDEF)-like protein/PAS domain S-box-containing protein
LRSTRNLTFFGFVLMLGLMVALMAAGLSRMGVINENLETIVKTHNAKMTLVWEMRHAARERAMILYHTAHTEDPFARDELKQRFSQYAVRFIQARTRLEASGLTPEERGYLDASLTLARQGESAQNTVLELLDEGRQDAAQDLLYHRVVPVQDRVMAQLTLMLESQQEAALIAQNKAKNAFQDALRLMLGFGLLTLVVGSLVASYVIRRSSAIETELHQEKERAQITLHSIGEAVISTDEHGLVTYLNPVAERMTGWLDSEAQGRFLTGVLHLSSERSKGAVQTAFDPLHIEAWIESCGDATELTARNGTSYAVEFTASPIHAPDGQVRGATLVLRDVTVSRELSRQISWAASHDALTGLINRNEFERRLEWLLQDARTLRREHALLYLDLDQFKVVNDTCGHIAGDELLRQLTARLTEKMRSSDSLGRLGGDEFGLLLDNCPLDKAADMAETLRSTVAQFRFMWESKPFDVGVSIGVVPITADSVSATQLLSTVDAACYVAKDKGRNQVHVFKQDDTETSQRTGEMSWSQQLSQAIQEDRLLLYAQKIMPLNGDPGQRPHLEILVRMEGAANQAVPPMSFIPAAERYGMMPALDRWVIRNVLARLSRHDMNSVDASCSINLSGQSLGDTTMLPYILEQFEQTGVAPQHICFEITETAAVSNLRAAVQFIQTLRELGCHFSLDDFGSGMSSFGYLRQLNVDYLKIDGAFVRTMRENETDRAMVAAINNIGHVMGLRTVAEYVADAVTLELLRGMGIDYAQGYGLHRPELLTDDFIARLDWGLGDPPAGKLFALF